MPVPEDGQLVGIQIEDFGQFCRDWNRPGLKIGPKFVGTSKFSPNKAYF
jgi:hypothetical protein